MKQKLPNILTLLRMLLTIALLALRALSPGFIALYLVCCDTDVADGALARRFNARTELGARLDSAADLALTAVIIVKLWPVLDPTPLLAVCTAAVALIRLAAGIAARVRFGKFSFLHTYLNKATGFLLFLLPPAAAVVPPRVFLFVLVSAALISAVEELIIELTSTSLDLDRKSIIKEKKDGI